MEVVRRIPPEHIVPTADIIDKYAQLMGVKKGDITDGRLYNFIEQWAGTPYKFGGLDREGIDCSGFTLLLQQQVYGISVPRTTKLQVSVINRKYENELKEGDLVFFDFDGKPFSHVGVYLQNGYVVHASTMKGVVVVPLHGAIYKYFTRAGSVPVIDSVIVAQN
ncbi:MAG: peptidoglycan endopeptidase [Mucilaginibacter sp.]|nr:peptidoglycan endopeptidase [Mucilaginibacter sp.]